MPTFTYRARNTTGQQVTGTLVADTAVAAARVLDERSLLPLEVNELAAERAITGQTRKVPISKIGMMYEQLADLLRAGVPVLRALSVLTKQASSAALVRVMREVHDSVAGGDSLADAMAKHPHAFPALHVSMLRAGEKGGFLEDVLTRLSEFVSRQDALKNKFIGALIYPMVLLLGGIAAVLFLMLYVIPQIREILEKQDLPFITHLVFGVSDAIGLYYLQMLVVIVAAVTAAATFFRTDAGRLLLARAQIGAWFIGPIYTMVALCRFCRVFGTLLANGIPILSALRTAKDSTGNVILAAVIDTAADHVSRGEPLSVPLAQSKLFPPAMVDMIAVAEESNTLEKVLIEIANTQEERTARQIDLVARLIEPAMLLLMGLMVTFIALALLLPILQLSTGGLK